MSKSINSEDAHGRCTAASYSFEAGSDEDMQCVRQFSATSGPEMKCIYFAENGFKLELSMESQTGWGSPYILTQMAQDGLAENGLKVELSMESQIDMISIDMI